MEPRKDHSVVTLLRERAETRASGPISPARARPSPSASSGAVPASPRCGLRALGIQPGELVAGLSYNSVDYLVLLHGLLRLGAVFAPLNPALQKDDLAQTLARIKPKVLIVSAEMGETLDAEVAGLLPLHRLEESVADGAVAGTPPEHPWKAGEWSWVIFSGATTGLPKGIMLPHQFCMAHANRAVTAMRMTAEDRFFSNLQMCHAWLNFVVLGSCLLAGAQCEATRWFSASRWLDQVHAFGATIVDPFLPMASALVAQPPSPRDRTHKVRCAPGPWGTVGEWEQRMAFEERFGIYTINCFGITEAGGMVACDNVWSPRPQGSTGKPTGDFEIVIADEEGNILPPGAQGEVLYRPTRPAVMSLGYLGDAERTLQTWRDLWIHSADLGYIDAEGYIYFTGRMPHWLRRKGENVSAREVEMALRNLPGVADAAVLGVPSKLGDDDIKALVVLQSGIRRAPAELHAQLRERLSFFKVPRFIEIVESFPRTIKAEPDRKRLQAEHKLHGGEWDAEAERPARGQAVG